MDKENSKNILIVSGIFILKYFELGGCLYNKSFFMKLCEIYCIVVVNRIVFLYGKR